MTSIWAHFKEVCLLFKMSPNWGHLLHSFRSNSLPKLMLFSEKWQKPLLQFESLYLWDKLSKWSKLGLFLKSWQSFRKRAQVQLKERVPQTNRAKDLNLGIKMSSNWDNLLYLFRSNHLLKLMLFSEICKDAQNHGSFYFQSVCLSIPMYAPPDASQAQIWLSGQRPLRGRSPVKHKGTFVRPSIHPSPLGSLRPEICPPRPGVYPLKPEICPFGQRPQRGRWPMVPHRAIFPIWCLCPPPWSPKSGLWDPRAGPWDL